MKPFFKIIPVLGLILFANLAFSQIQTPSDPKLLQNTWRLGAIVLPDKEAPSPTADRQDFLVFQGDQECTYVFSYGVLNIRQCTPFTANELTLTDQSGTYNWKIATGGHIKVPLALFLTINDPKISQQTGLPVGTVLGYVGNSSLPSPPNPAQIQGTWKLKVVTKVDPSTGQPKSLTPPADESSYGVFQGNQVCDHDFKGKVLKEKKCVSFSIDGFNFSREGATLNWGIDSGGYLNFIFPDGKTVFGYEKATLPSAAAPPPTPSTPKPPPTPPTQPVLPTPLTAVEKTPEAARKTDISVSFIPLGAMSAVLFLFFIATWIFKGFFARLRWLKRDESGKPLWTSDWSGWTLKGRLFFILTVLILGIGTWIGTFTRLKVFLPFLYEAESTYPSMTIWFVVGTAIAAFFIAFFLMRLFVIRLWIKLVRKEQPQGPLVTKREWVKLIAVALIASVGFTFAGYTIFTKPNILKNSFPPSKEISIPNEGAVTYKNRAGKSFTVPAYEEQILILVQPGTSHRKVNSLVKENGGKVISQIPATGIYLAEVRAGYEADFLVELLQEPIVLNAFPNPIESFKASVQIDFWTENDVPKGFTDATGKTYYYVLPSEPGGILGLTADKSKGASHGDLVRYFILGKKFEKSERDECFFAAKTCIPAGFFNLYPMANIIESKRDDDYITFNLSFGPKDTDENEKPLPPATIQELEENSLRGYLNILQSEGTGVEKTILVRAAGNSGTDLTEVFKNLASATEKGQQALDRLIVVGAVDEKGKLLNYSSYSNNPKDIIYVPVKERVQTSLYGGKQLLEGTSFAAPQIMYLINQILDKYPELAKEPAKLKSILFSSSVAKLKAVVDSTGASHPLRYYIEDPYDPKTIENALKVAGRLIAGLPAEEPREAKEKSSGQKALPKTAPSPAAKESEGSPIVLPPTPTPPPLPTPLPAPSASTPTDLTVQSTSCVPAGGVFDEFGMFTVTLKGTAQGPVETKFDVSVGYIPETLTLTQASWTRGGSSNRYASIFRSSNDPEMTSWTIEGIYRGFGGFSGVWLQVSLTTPLGSNVPGKTQDVTVSCK